MGMGSWFTKVDESWMEVVGWEGGLTTWLRSALVNKGANGRTMCVGARTSIRAKHALYWRGFRTKLARVPPKGIPGSERIRIVYMKGKLMYKLLYIKNHLFFV